jgi:hypothetical protein
VPDFFETLHGVTMSTKISLEVKLESVKIQKTYWCVISGGFQSEPFESIRRLPI